MSTPRAARSPRRVALLGFGLVGACIIPDTNIKTLSLLLDLITIIQFI